MSTGAILFGWNRPIPGREQMSAQHFQDYLGYLTGLQGNGAIDSFEVVLLNPHGGDLNGFFLIRGESDQLNALQASDDWGVHTTRGGLHLEGSGAIRGVTGEGVMEQMNRWSGLLPD